MTFFLQNLGENSIFLCPLIREIHGKYHESGTPCTGLLMVFSKKLRRTFGGLFGIIVTFVINKINKFTCSSQIFYVVCIAIKCPFANTSFESQSSLLIITQQIHFGIIYIASRAKLITLSDAFHKNANTSNCFCLSRSH